MNAPNLIPKPNGGFETSDNLPSTWWRMGFAFLLLATPLARADLLPKNFWVNPSFELGSDLNQTTGTVANWNRGDNTATICEVITNNSVSPGHSLAVTDTTAGDLYGEWYSCGIPSLCTC